LRLSFDDGRKVRVPARASLAESLSAIFAAMDSSRNTT
jgi:hypothetical protein